LSGAVETHGLTEQNTGADVVIAKNCNEAVRLVRAVKRLLNRQPLRKPAASQVAMRAYARARACAPALLLICAWAADPAVRKPPPPRPAALKTSPAVRRWMRPMTARDEVAQ